MKIEVYPTPDGIIERELAEKTVIVIDSLRMTSTVVTALENGAREVVPVAEVEEAASIAGRLGRENVLLCGERHAMHIPGFDLSNSPLEYHHDVVQGRVLVITTTNGARAILRAKDAAHLYLGCFLNAKAVAQAASLQGRDVAIVCAGTNGRFSLEDVLAAGAIIERLLPHFEALPKMDDLAQAAIFLYRYNEEDLMTALRGTTHYERLKEAGFESDLRFCLTLDVMNAVPYYAGGALRSYQFTPVEQPPQTEQAQGEDTMQ